jgi:Methyl-accepting chemotaxis protein
MIKMEKIFEGLIESVSTIKELFEEDTSVSIENNEEILYVSHGHTMKLPVKVGDKLNEDFVRNKLKKEKKTINVVLNKEEHGVDIRIIKVPVLNNKGEMIGAFSLNRNNERENLIRYSSNNLMGSLEETNKTIDKIADSASELSTNLNTLIEKSEAIENTIRNSSEAVNLIQSISKQVNMLGLNASIESSKAGEYGKGFSVVASEMRKLSVLSGQSSGEIASSLLVMQENMKYILQSINEIGKIADKQAVATRDVSATMEEITLNSHELVESIKNP